MITINLGGNILSNKNMLKPVDYPALFQQCHNCGFVFICKEFITCPFCESKNIKNVPIGSHKSFSMTWLKNHGFPYLDVFIGGENILTEQEVKNIVINEREHLEQILDPIERKCVGAFIAGLECVLNE